MRLWFGLLNAFLALHLFTHYIGAAHATSGHSMDPTIEHRDRIIMSYHYRGGKDVQVGDLVSYKHPMHVGQNVVKRIVGMPGDFVLRDTPPGGAVVLEDKSREVLDVVVDDSVPRDHWMVQVPEGHFWASGDNVPFSRDSRHYGPVPLALINSKVVMKIGNGWTRFKTTEEGWAGTRRNVERAVERRRGNVGLSRSPSTTSSTKTDREKPQG